MPVHGSHPVTHEFFQKVNLRRDGIELRPEELKKGNGVEAHTELGTLTKRPGTAKQFTTPLSDVVVRQLHRMGTTRYRVAGRTIYRGETAVTDYRGEPLSADLQSGLVPYIPLNDTTEWLFIADRAVMQKDNGTVTRRWGLAKPLAAYGRFGPTAQTSLLSYTHIRFDDDAVAHESNPTTVRGYDDAGSINAAHGYIERIPDPLDSQVDGFGFYRTVAGGSLPLIEERIKIPTAPRMAVTFGWEVSPEWVGPEGSDGELYFQQGLPGALPNISVAETESVTYSPSGWVVTQPWEAHYIPAAASTSNNTTLPDIHINRPLAQQSGGTHGTHLWEIDEGFADTTQTKYWAYGTERTDAALGAAHPQNHDLPPHGCYVEEFDNHLFVQSTEERPHAIYWSKKFLPESFPAKNFIEIGSPSDPGKGMVAQSGFLLAFTLRRKYRIFGDDANGFIPTETISKRGTPAPRSIVATERGVLFVAFDGAFSTTGLSVDDELSGDITPIFYGKEMNGYKPINWGAAATICAAYYQNQYLFAYPSGEATQPDTVALYSFETRGWTFFSFDGSALYLEPDTRTLLIGSIDGLVYEYDTGTDDAGTAIDFDIESGDFVANDEGAVVRAIWLQLKIDADTDDRPVTVEVFIDGISTYERSLDFIRKTTVLPLPEGLLGRRCSVRLRHNQLGTCKVYSITAIALPLTVN